MSYFDELKSPHYIYGETQMETSKFISSLLLTTAASSTFALSNQEIVTLLNQQAKQTTHHLYQSKQNNNDLNWASLHGPRVGDRLNVVAMKNNPSMLFAFNNSILQKSIDGGQNWKALTAPKNINDLVAVDDNRLILAADGNIYTSTDQGEHWRPSANLDVYCDKLFVLNPNFVLMETNSRSGMANVYRSFDGGISWTPARLGLDTGKYGVWGMGGRDNLLFVATDGLNISTNGGVFWTQADKWNNYLVHSVAVSSKHDIFVATGNLYKTDPTGQTWERINSESIGSIYNVQVDKHDKIYVIANYSHPGLYRSIDNGKTWELLEQFSDLKSFTLLDNGKIILSTRDGLMEYDENQKHLSKLPISFSASTTTKVFALDENNIFAIDHSLYSTHDGGKTWNLNRANYNVDVTGFNDEVLTLEWRKENNKEQQHLLTSKDQGQTWQEVKLPTIKRCDAFSSENNALILTCDDGQYLTHDLSHWKRINSEDKAASYVYGQTIYTSNGNSIKLSTDEGSNWITLLDKLNLYRTYISGHKNKVVLVAISEAGIIKTTDGGTSWELINDGITDFNFTGFMALDENNYIVTTGNGVFATQNGGKYWAAENNGLDNVDIYSLFANKNMLVVGTAGSGVFKTSLK